jgi:hypothetical protein
MMAEGEPMPHRALWCRDRSGHARDGKRPHWVRGIDIRSAPNVVIQRPGVIS